MAEPRHFILPDGMVSTGWPAVRDTCAQVGIRFDRWQQDLNRAMLAKDADGLYAADTVVLSMARQTGKTYDVGGVTFADSIIHPGTTTVWTAHHFKVARESFNELKDLARTPQMAPHVDPHAITTGAGNESIPFRNGSRILFAARERAAIRGFAKVRRLVLDEAQILTESAMADMAPTLNQAWNPQVVLMGSPPKSTDRGEVFTVLRTEALDGKSEGVLYVEYGADPDCDVDSWEAVGQANPTFPHRTTKRAIRRLRKLLTSDDDYAREVLGIWDASGLKPTIDPDIWLKRRDVESKTSGKVAFAVDVPPEGGRASISRAGRRDDSKVHVEVDRRDGTLWTIEKLVKAREKRRSASVLLDPTSQAAGLIQPLMEAGVEPELVSGREMAAACAHFLTLVEEDGLRHTGQLELTSAVDAARKRNVGQEGGWAWHRRDTAADISPLVAATLAVHGVSKPGKRREHTGKAVFI